MLSRVADNLYWMSRYLERAEHTARLVDVQLNLSLDQSGRTPQADRWARLLKVLHVPLPAEGIRDEYSLTHLLVFDPANVNSVAAAVGNGRENARQVREKISSEMWMQANRLYLDVRRTTLDSIWAAQPHEFFRAVKEGVHLFQGITDSTLMNDQGWQFMQLGRCLERAVAIAALLDAHLQAFPLPQSDHDLMAEDYFEWLGLLKSLTAFEAYCKVYNADLRARRIVEFLMFNPEFPHAMRFCVEQMQAALQAIAESTGTSKNSRVHRLSGRLRSALSFDTVDEMLTRGPHAYLEEFGRQCAQLHEALCEAYISYPVESVLT